MKINKLFKKTFAIAAIAAVTLSSIVFCNAKTVKADDTRVISDDKATAYINSDGSGYIELKQSFSRDEPLTQIGGVPLKEIITFNDDGYVSEFYTEGPSNYNWASINQIVRRIYPYMICVDASGPKGFFSGSGHLHFTDEANDTYDLSIWLSGEYGHHVSYNSEKPNIVKISWNS